MNNHVIRTARLTDGQIVDLLIAIRDDIRFDSATIGFGLTVNREIDPRFIETELEQYRGNSHAILSVHVNLGQNNLAIRFLRGTCSNPDQPDANRQASPYFDEIFVCRQNNNQQLQNPDAILKCLAVIEDALSGNLRTLQDNEQDVVSVLRAEASALDSIYRTMLKDFADERNEFLKGFEEQRRSVEEERQTAKAKLEAEAEQRRQEFQERMESEEAKLSQRRAELDAREEELDNRQHMHVRRELREKISAELKRRSNAPVVSERASQMRLMIFFLTLSAGVGLAGFGLWTFYLLVGAKLESASYWVLVVRAALLSVGGVGLFLYAVQWLRSIYLDDVRTTRHYDNYRDDIDRASFAIETIMEISSEKEGVPAPDAWIEGVCRNLFRSDVGDRVDEGQQTDAFIELLKSISSASVGPNGAEVTLDRRGGRRLAKKMSADNG